MDKKPLLQSVTSYKVMNIKECLDALGWNYKESGSEYQDISCPCGGKMEFSGFVGTEVVECTKCGKRMVDLFSPIRTGNSTATILDPQKYEFSEDLHWIAVDGNGGIMAYKEDDRPC
jgi:hypothetical protein